MKANDVWDSLTENLNSFVVLILSGLIDVGFVVIWLITQFLLSRYVIRTPLVSSLAHRSPSGDSWILLTFQLVFAISTLVPVALYIVTDVIIGIRRWAEIRKEI